MFEFKENAAVKTFFNEVFSLVHTYENFYDEEGNYKTGQFREVERMYSKDGAGSKKEYRCKNHTTPTPLPIVMDMLNSAFCEQKPNKNSKILVFFTLEIVYSLVYNFGIEYKNITFFSDHEIKTEFINTFSDNATEIIFDKEKLMTKKFDFVFGNPPYVGKAALHQQIFNKAVTLVKDDGYVVFVQPATPYQNKKEKKKGPENEMIANVLKYRSKVCIHPGTVFEAAGIMTDVAITTLQKTKSIPVVNQITYKNGETYEKVKIENISITEFSPEMYESIISKFMRICGVNGSVGGNMTKDTSVESVFISKVRGHPNDPDFFTIVPRADGRIHYCENLHTDFGLTIPVDNSENFYDYCESYVARMGLATLKFNSNLANGELNLVPMFDFSRTYTDVELYQMVGLTEEEINAIENFLPDYYGRKA